MSKLPKFGEKYFLIARVDLCHNHIYWKFIRFLNGDEPGEVRVLLVLLDEVGEGGEDEDTHGQEEK